jgi:hypothetical protein
MLSFSIHASQAYATTGLTVDQYNISFDLLDSNLHWTIFLLSIKFLILCIYSFFNFSYFIILVNNWTISNSNCFYF